jgi:hypothetical protein
LLEEFVMLIRTPDIARLPFLNAGWPWIRGVTSLTGVPLVAAEPCCGRMPTYRSHPRSYPDTRHS